jgi:hypothetical protein
MALDNIRIILNKALEHAKDSDSCDCYEAELRTKLLASGISTSLEVIGALE